MSGGQLVAQGPLHTDLPLPAASRSNVYSVMPPAPTSTPSMVFTGESFMVAQPANAAAATKEAIEISFFMGFSRVWCRRRRMLPCTGTNTWAQRFIPRRRKKISRAALGERRPHRTHASAAATFHGALHLALAFAVLDGVALVMLSLALGQGNFAFHKAVFPVQIERHQRVALLLDLADQALDIVFLEQQFLGARRFGVDVGGGGLERMDQAAEQIQLAIAVQQHARLVAFLEEIVVSRFLVVGNAGRRIGFFGHEEVDAAQTGS